MIAEIAAAFGYIALGAAGTLLVVAAVRLWSRKPRPSDDAMLAAHGDVPSWERDYRG